MNSPFLFIPLAIYLLVVFGGFVCLMLAALGLKKARTAQGRPDAREAEPATSTGTARPASAPSGCWIVCLKGFRAVGLIAVVLGLVGVWSTKVSIGWVKNPAAEWSDGRAPALEPLIRERCVPFMNSGKSIGLAVAVATPTNATIMTFGHPSLSSSAPTRAETLFELGSITKTFTALALEREIEQGTVRLDQPIQELLPSGVELPAEARGITLRHLTTHSSGFPRLAANSPAIRGIEMVLFGSDPYAGYTAADLLEAVRTVKLEFKPGTKSSYSNFGMTLLGYLLAAKAGSSYEALIKREVCQPLRMNDTTLTLDRAQARRAAQGYRVVWRRGPLVVALRSAPWFEANDLGGAGALKSTAGDMLKYLEANMRPEGEPLEDALREAQRELFKENERMAYGMNWVRTEGQTLKQTVIWHNGGTGGFHSFFGFAERSGVGVLVLSNTSESVDDLAGDLLRDLARWAGGRDRGPD